MREPEHLARRREVREDDVVIRDDCDDPPGSTLAYLSGGFGVRELVYPAIATPVAYLSLRSYRFVGIGWLMHAGWDVLHHLFGNPIWPFMPTSSFGCVVFDSAIAVWFLAGAPTMVRLPRLSRSAPSAARPSP